MINVLTIDGDLNWPIERQSFASKGIAKNVSFGSKISNADCLVTFGNLPHFSEIAASVVPIEKRFCILMENARFHLPQPEYLSLHKYVICPFEITVPDGVLLIKTHAAVPWFYDLEFDVTKGLEHSIYKSTGCENLESFCEVEITKKDRLVSMITSTKTISEGHKIRLELATSLKSKFASDIDLFGFGHNPISNKKSTLDRFKYSIIVENDFVDNYVTEKLCDAILGFCVPIYIGAPNVLDFFSVEFPTITPYGKSIDQITNEIQAIVNKDPKVNTQSLRYDVLFKLNYFYHISSIIKKYI